MTITTFGREQDESRDSSVNQTQHECDNVILWGPSKSGKSFLLSGMGCALYAIQNSYHAHNFELDLHEEKQGSPSLLQKHFKTPEPTSRPNIRVFEYTRKSMNNGNGTLSEQVSSSYHKFAISDYQGSIFENNDEQYIQTILASSVYLVLVIHPGHLSAAKQKDFLDMLSKLLNIISSNKNTVFKRCISICATQMDLGPFGNGSPTWDCINKDIERLQEQDEYWWVSPKARDIMERIISARFSCVGRETVREIINRLDSLKSQHNHDAGYFFTRATPWDEDKWRQEGMEWPLLWILEHKDRRRLEMQKLTNGLYYHVRPWSSIYSRRQRFYEPLKPAFDDLK